MHKIATRATWKNLPIDDPKLISIYLHFTASQFERMTKGYIPREMEDKWFIFYEEGWLYIHRSWTGYGIYKAQLIQNQNDYSIKELWVERNHEKYEEQNDEIDIERFSSLISWALLGKGLYHTEKMRAILFGVAVGDALGVPVEFNKRQTIRKNPVTDMIGYGTYNLPAGTFSDDSSLTFCLAEALTKEFDLNEIARNFVKWRYENFWTPLGEVFDIGIATHNAIYRLDKGTRPDLAGGTDEGSNGNGSLMRILPLLFLLEDKSITKRFEITRQVSSITHGHIRCVIACFYYLEYARELLKGKDKFKVYRNLQSDIPKHLNKLKINPEEIALFSRLFDQNIYELPDEKIYSTGYVLHTLEASIWCLLTTDNYESAVLKAVNLGEDTDTTGAVTGGLAGILYGIANIPPKWKNQIARHDDIEDLAERVGRHYCQM